MEVTARWSRLNVGAIDARGRFMSGKTLPVAGPSTSSTMLASENGSVTAIASRIMAVTAKPTRYCFR